MLSNAKVKYIKSLSSKKNRNLDKIFFVEGEKLVDELLMYSPQSCIEIFATSNWNTNINNANIESKLQIIDEKEMLRITHFKTPSSVLALVQQKNDTILQPASSCFTLVLDTIQDPGNFGTIIRIADWFGVKQIVCSNECAEQYNPKVLQATMGSIFRVNIFYCDIKDWLKKQKDCNIYATTLHGKDVYKMDKIKNGVIIIGNESQGIDKNILDECKTQITIPQRGKAESLNAAVATGIILSHLL